MKYVIGSVNEYSDGVMKTVSAGGKSLAVANVGGIFFAVDDICSHAHCSLGTDGFLDGKAIMCGCHGSLFDLETGHVLTPPAASDIHAYNVTVEGNDVSVDI